MLFPPTALAPPVAFLAFATRGWGNDPTQRRFEMPTDADDGTVLAVSLSLCENRWRGACGCVFRGRWRR